jgi:hypothetical protein
MTTASLNDRLLQSLRAAQEKEAVLLAFVDDAPSSDGGQWTAKDNIAHLNSWREHAAHTLAAARLGTPFPGPAVDTDVDASNAVIYEAHRGDSAAAVRAAYHASYSVLIEAINACSEEDLLRERPDSGGAVWLVVPGNGHAHTSQHLTYWAFDQGDAGGAEEAAKWSYALDSELLPENRPVADYNFACFYARTRDVEKALPLLGAALRARPDLRAYALEDADLQPIRDDPRLQSLLGA